jgi:hypothetical protein
MVEDTDRVPCAVSKPAQATSQTNTQTVHRHTTDEYERRA